MRIIKSIKEMSCAARKIKQNDKTVGFVPTMGALHEGHLSLMRKARRENDCVVVSIFVNPSQFGPKEDFKKYPRDIKRDVKLCKQAGVDIIFLPAADEIYPKDYRTYVEVGGLGNCLCGKFRPGHFRGVATIVIKLLNIVCPDTAYFGQKDAQQCAVIKRMAVDLNFPVKIKILSTVREKDGLAMSSRNAYLSASERKDAAVLYQALRSAKKSIRRGKVNSLALTQGIRKLISRKKSARIQYISIVDTDSLKPLHKINRKALIALAVFIGKTRLIDNIAIN